MLTPYTTASDSAPSQPTRAFWLDVLNPTADEIARVTADYGIQVPSRESLEEIETSSRLRASGRVLYLSMPLSTDDEAAGFAPVPLGFILSPQLLVTVRFSEVHAFAQVRAAIGTGPPEASAAFCALIDAMVDFSADSLERLSYRLAALSAQTFSPQGSSHHRDKGASGALRVCLKAVGGAGDHLSHFRESMLGLQRIIGFVSKAATDWLSPEEKARLGTAQQDLASLVDFEAHLSAKTQFLLDAVLGLVNIEQNDLFKVLTIASVVGIPPTLIASMYGMNFHGMPELDWRWGYPYGLSLILLSIVVPIVWFKRRGWW